MLVTICVGDNFEKLVTISVTNIGKITNNWTVIYRNSVTNTRKLSSTYDQHLCCIDYADKNESSYHNCWQQQFEIKPESCSKPCNDWNYWRNGWFWESQVFLAKYFNLISPYEIRKGSFESKFYKLTIRNRSIWEHFTKFNCFFLICRSKITIYPVTWTVITELWFVFKLMW